MDVTTVRALFERNAATYDRVNSLISLGLDSRWRRWAAAQAAPQAGARVLDAYCGTGLAGLAAVRRGASVTFADATPAMLRIVQQRLSSRGLAGRVVLADLTAAGSELPRASFDSVILGFGLRYMDDPAGTLRILASLLAEDGRIVVLEFVPLPKRAPLLDRLAAGYFFSVLPRVATALSREAELYRYLVSSTRGIGSSACIDGWLDEAGLRLVQSRRMGFGLVYGAVATLSLEAK